MSSGHKRQRQHCGRVPALLWTEADSSYALMSVHHVTITSRWGSPSKMDLRGLQGSLVHPLPCTCGCWLAFRAWGAFCFLHPVCLFRTPALTVFSTCLLRRYNKPTAAAVGLDLTLALHSSQRYILGHLLDCYMSPAWLQHHGRSPARAAAFHAPSRSPSDP